jgi:hypothetical protein
LLKKVSEQRKFIFCGVLLKYCTFVAGETKVQGLKFKRFKGEIESKIF